MKWSFLVAVLLCTSAAVQALPFVPTTGTTTYPIHWYQLKTENKYIYSNPRSFGDVDVSSTASDSDDYLWCFVGDESTGYKIYNRGTKGYMIDWRVYDGPNDFGVNYYEAGSGDAFYIYFLEKKGGGTDKWYLSYDATNGFNGTRSKLNSYTVSEVFVESNMTDTPEIDFEVYDDKGVVTAKGKGEVKLFIGNDRVENPYTILRTDEDQHFSVTAMARETGKQTAMTSRHIIVPHLEVVNPEIFPELTPYAFSIPNNQLDNEGDEGYKKLFDNDDATKWCVVNTTGRWQPIWVEFKSSFPIETSSYLLTAGDDTFDYPNRNPSAWTVYAKAKESDSWSAIGRIDSNNSWKLSTTGTSEFGMLSGVYQYFRFEVNNILWRDSWYDNYTFQLAEFRFRAKKAKLYGDVTGDYKVDVEDVNALINIILELKRRGDYSGEADVAFDYKIDVEDVNEVINIILGLD